MRVRRRGVQARFLATGLAVVAGSGVGSVIYAAGHTRKGNSGGERGARQETQAAKEQNAHRHFLNPAGVEGVGVGTARGSTRGKLRTSAPSPAEPA